MEDKVYYSISEVAELFDVNQSLIRFWETQFPKYIKPKRNKRGVRSFSKKDIENIKSIYNLLKIQKYTIDGAKEELKAMRKSDKTNETTIAPKNNMPVQTLFDFKENDEDLNKTERFIKYNHKELFKKISRIKELAEKLYKV